MLQDPPMGGLLFSHQYINYHIPFTNHFCIIAIEHPRIISLAMKLFIAVALLVIGLFPSPGSGQTSETPIEITTKAPTQESTDATTQEPTEATTDAITQEPTEATTDATTQEPTEATTDATTQEPTEATTDATTREPTEATTDATTQEPTDGKCMRMHGINSFLDPHPSSQLQVTFVLFIIMLI